MVEYNPKLILSPSNLQLSDDAVYVGGDDEMSRKVFAEVDCRNEERARTRWFEDMEGLREYWNMPLD
ncbi:hypothetical protein J4416_04940 [Candidatus Pacearchaeota archaeon]|nr:hypothetical protein [Candidatus Pacearchaeota archaeon]